MPFEFVNKIEYTQIIFDPKTKDFRLELCQNIVKLKLKNPYSQAITALNPGVLNRSRIQIHYQTLMLVSPFSEKIKICQINITLLNLFSKPSS